jgi:hypothetical protein
LNHTRIGSLLTGSCCLRSYSATPQNQQTAAFDRPRYTKGNRASPQAYPQLLERFAREKAKFAAALRSPQHEDFLDASIRQFSATANARLQACADFDAKRQFLIDHVERVIYNRYNVTIAGCVPVQSASGETKLPFRIEGKIDIAAIRSAASREAALETMRALESVSHGASGMTERV